MMPYLQHKFDPMKDDYRLFFLEYIRLSSLLAGHGNYSSKKEAEIANRELLLQEERLNALIEAEKLLPHWNYVGKETRCLKPIKKSIR